MHDAGAGGTDDDDDIAVPLRSRWPERAQYAQKLPYVVPTGGLIIIGGVTLLAAGATGFERAFAIGEPAMSVLLIRATVRDDVTAIDTDRFAAEIRRRAGRARRINLRDMENAGPVRAVLERAQARLAAYAAPRTPPDLGHA